MKKNTIKVGDIIYIDTQLYVSHGADDIIGGKTRIIKIEDNNGRQFVTVEIEPSASYGWAYLSKEQSKLKAEFGNQWAYHKPDYRTEFNSFY